jgi:hypothetical protein
MVRMATPRQASISQKRGRGAGLAAVSGRAVAVNGELLWLDGANTQLYHAAPCDKSCGADMAAISAFQEGRQKP